MARVVGTDPGTSSLDLLLMVDGVVADQARLATDELRSRPAALTDLLRDWSPLDVVAGPSGYGLPMVQAGSITDREMDLMALVRPDQKGQTLGVIGFRAWARAFVESGLNVVFLPGLIHLPTVPAHRKVNTIDLGTPDKLAVAALALRTDSAEHGNGLAASTFAVVEIGSAFTAVLIVSEGRLVDAAAGTRGPIGLKSGGAWDGEVAYWRSPLSKNDLFRGGLADLGGLGLDAFRESLARHVGGLRTVTPFDRIYLSGGGLDRPEIAGAAAEGLNGLGRLMRLSPLQGAWVKHAAQGAALIADGIAGGPNADLVASLRLNEASGTACDWVGAPPF